MNDAPPPYGDVVFDCDSTLSRIEGIEELARLAEPALVAEVERHTELAMSGAVSLESVYSARLEILRPSAEDMRVVARRYFEERMPHAVELVRALRALGKRVHVVSGGLLPAVKPFALQLGIDEPDVHAVDVTFDGTGAFASHEDSPLARSGGKPLVIRELGAGPRVLVGDGVTDLEAAPVCARFIAFGGVERREAVFGPAQVGVDAPDLARLLPYLTTPRERHELAASPEHAALVEAAKRS